MQDELEPLEETQEPVTEEPLSLLAGETDVVPSAPEPEPEPQPEREPEAELEPDPQALSVSVPRVPWWPFTMLIVLWIALSGTAAYLLTRASDVPAYEQQWYPIIVVAGIVLTALGPVIGVATWAVIRNEGSGHDGGGLFAHSILRAAVITLLGVVAWWGILVAVDALRLGLIAIDL